MITTEMLQDSENYPCTSCGDTIDIAQLSIARASPLTQKKYAESLAAGAMTLRLCPRCAWEIGEKIAAAATALRISSLREERAKREQEDAP